MTKMLGANTSFSTSIQKVVELNEGMIINGQYYFKDTLTPKSLSFFNMNGASKELSMNKKFTVKGSAFQSYKTKNSTILTDSTDPTITYMFTTNTRANTYWIYKFRETENGATLINSTAQSVNNYIMPNEIAGQDDTYIYYTIQYSSTTILYRAPKTTLVPESIFACPSGVSTITFLKETTNFIYYFYHQTNGVQNAYRYNKQTKVNEKLTNLPAYTGGVTCNTITSQIQFTDTEKMKGYFYTTHVGATTPFDMYISKYEFDFTLTALDQVFVRETKPTIVKTVPFTLPNLVAGNSSFYESFVIDSTSGEKFLVVAVYDTTTNTAADVGKHGFYVYKINTNGDLEQKQFLSFSSSVIRGFLATSNFKTVIAASDMTVYFITFDEISKNLIVSDQSDSQPAHIGLDKNENIWIVNSLEEVDLISLSTPTNVEIKFEKENYKYEGQDVDSYIIIDAKNFQGNRVAITLELSIKGDAVFKSSNSKLLREVTDLNGEKRIDIVVKGAGSITIYPKLVM